MPPPPHTHTHTHTHSRFASAELLFLPCLGGLVSLVTFDPRNANVNWQKCPVIDRLLFSQGLKLASGAA